jgi:hypothetical protein
MITNKNKLHHSPTTKGVTAMPNQSHVKNVPAETGPLIFTRPASNFVASLGPYLLNGTETARKAGREMLSLSTMGAKARTIERTSSGVIHFLNHRYRN